LYKSILEILYYLVERNLIWEFISFVHPINH
jgi:hypothetical protein